MISSNILHRQRLPMPDFLKDLVSAGVDAITIFGYTNKSGLDKDTVTVDLFVGGVLTEDMVADDSVVAGLCDMVNLFMISQRLPLFAICFASADISIVSDDEIELAVGTCYFNSYDDKLFDLWT